MLEGETIKCLGIVNCGKYCAGPPIFQIGQYFLPHLDKHVCAAAALDAAKLVVLGLSILTQMIP